jgi:hypothetical protein
MSDRQSELESRPLLQRSEALELCRVYGVGSRTFRKYIREVDGLRRRHVGYVERHHYVTGVLVNLLKRPEA